ncbi:MAG: hypothetical protein A2W91_09860 [Bacteroidetes bacterium GWF2_38_335]|nr:MAG: hypothetical protein A2W91_09860 [Bacteroidetes bacterium GWF2_38_335]HBS88067.1 hypothetical protein [Bacteroidales bacterium]
MYFLRFLFSRNLPGFILFFLVICAISFVFGNRVDDELESVLIPLILILLILLFFIVPVFFLRRYVTNDFFTQNLKLTIDDNGIKLESLAEVKTANFNEIKDIYIHRKFILILIPKQRTIIVPNDAVFIDNSRKQLIDYLKSRASNLIVEDMESINNRKGNLLYLLGILCLIPYLGAFVGIILAALGLGKNKNKILVAIGSIGVIITIFVHINIVNARRELNKDKYFETKKAKGMLIIIVKDIELYKVQFGVYPDSLEQLNEIEPVDIIDPLGVNQSKYCYKKSGSKYTLFSIGLDGKMNTKDDIFPVIKDKNGKFGLIIENSAK